MSDTSNEDNGGGRASKRALRRKSSSGRQKKPVRKSLEGTDDTNDIVSPEKKKRKSATPHASASSGPKCVLCGVAGGTMSKPKSDAASETVNKSINALKLACLKCNPTLSKIIKITTTSSSPQGVGVSVHKMAFQTSQCPGWDQIRLAARRVKVRGLCCLHCAVCCLCYKLFTIIILQLHDVPFHTKPCSCSSGGGGGAPAARHELDVIVTQPRVQPRLGVVSNQRFCKCIVCGEREDRHSGSTQHPSVLHGHDHANIFLRAAAAHIIDADSTYHSQALALAGLIGVGEDLPRKAAGNTSDMRTLRDSFFAHEHLFVWGRDCRRKWNRILATHSTVPPTIVAGNAGDQAQWLQAVVDHAVQGCRSGCGIIPYSTLSAKIEGERGVGMGSVAGSVQKGWRNAIADAIAPHGLSIAGSASTGYYVWTDSVKENAAHQVFKTWQRAEHGEHALEFVAGTSNQILEGQPVDVLLNDAAMVVHNAVSESRPQKTEAFYGPGISMSSCLDYVGGSCLPSFFYSVLTGLPYDPSAYDHFKVDGMDEGGHDTPVHEGTKELYRGMSLASTLMMCATGIPGPWQAGLSNELRANNTPKRLQDKLAGSGISGNARFSREQENAYCADSDTSAYGTLVATALKHRGRCVICMSSDNCDWCHGGSTDGGTSTSIINREARVLLVEGEAPDLVESTRERGPLLGTAPEIVDATPEAAPIVQRKNPTEASASSQTAVLDSLNGDAGGFMEASQRGDLAWVFAGTADDGTIKPGHPEWTEFNKQTRRGLPIPKLDHQLPLAPIMLSPTSPEGIKAVLDGCMQLKKDTGALAVFLDCDVGEWLLIVQQVFGTEYEKHIVPMQGGFHTATKVRKVFSIGKRLV